MGLLKSAGWKTAPLLLAWVRSSLIHKMAKHTSRKKYNQLIRDSATGFPERSKMNPSYKVIAILFGIGVTLHNLEEARYLASWTRSHLKLRFDPNPKIYWVSTSLVSVVIWVPIVGVCLLAASRHFQGVLSGFALAMAVNALLTHFVISLVKHSYSPGAGTGMLFNLPLGVLLIRGQLNAHAISHAQVWRDAVLYALLLAAGAFGSLYGAHATFARRKK